MALSSTGTNFRKFLLVLKRFHFLSNTGNTDGFNRDFNKQKGSSTYLRHKDPQQSVADPDLEFRSPENRSNEVAGGLWDAGEDDLGEDSGAEHGLLLQQGLHKVSQSSESLP
jgi:hypothetical protein